MHPAINAAFETLCRRYGSAGSVLEIGATPTPDTLLNLPALTSATRRLGVNMEGPSRIGAAEILGINAHAMPMLESASFDLVLCNSTFEHDPMFWLSLAEIRRVLRTDGVAIYGVPGYTNSKGSLPKLKGLAARLWPAPLPGGTWLAGAAASTATLHVHNFPGDYYRFSEQAMREVLLEGFDVLEVAGVLRPPRIIGVGRKRG